MKLRLIITNRTKLNVRTSTTCNTFIKPFNQQCTHNAVNIRFRPYGHLGLRLIKHAGFVIKHDQYCSYHSSQSHIPSKTAKIRTVNLVVVHSHKELHIKLIYQLIKVTRISLKILIYQNCNQQTEFFYLIRIRIS